ncbi:hypothetical protein [Pseudomonas quasicaspiana]|uniref:hypothetical protein n=1 Tax=Pseudomonas quasicaspiana TaxID=2829821 RepID=UPI001E637D0C|nr:hypothetical protein [Pseudomonas quasicaspiana]MCD5969784.1 hypothetical protein [Pseudomonas quasicaspiana]
MIKEIEKLMVHWGEQTRERGLGGGLGSQLGALIEWGGAPPRSTPGSRVLQGGTGMDTIATAIDRAVAQLQRTPGQAALARLATQRYCELVPVREQMRTAGIAEGADRTYRNWVQRLHEQVMSIVMASTSKRGVPSST